MTKIDIISGFLGAGKTTLIKKLISEAYTKERLVIIENEFGQIAIDGGFLKDSGVRVTEMNSGCICCSLVGDFAKSLQEVVKTYSPDRIVIEPSGVGKLSDVIKAIEQLENNDIQLNSATTVVDAKKCKVYAKNFGEFFNNQLEHAHSIILSRTDSVSPERINEALELIHSINSKANVITTPWDRLNGNKILEAMVCENLLDQKIGALEEEHHHEHACCCHHDHHDCEHEHHHHDHHKCEHEHHHHDHHECEHEHHHHDHHEHEHGCSCHHDHHEHHHADEVFSSWGCQTARLFTKDELDAILESLNAQDRFGHVLRAKGIVGGADGTWLHFDFVPHEFEVREGSAEVTGSVCVIGAELNETQLHSLFR